MINKTNSRKGVLRQKPGVWLLSIFLLIALGGAGWYFMKNTPGTQIVQAQQQNYTAVVQRYSMKDYAAGSGTLVTVQTDNLSFTEDGTMTFLNVRVGDKVKSGDALASLENLIKLESSVVSAELNVLNAEQQLNALQKKALTSAAIAYEDWLNAKNTFDEAMQAEARTKGSRCSKVVTMRYATQLKNKTDEFENAKNTPSIEQYKNAEYAYQTALANFEYCRGYTDEEKRKASASRQVAEDAFKEAEDQYQTLKKSSGIDPNELYLAEATLRNAKTQLKLAQKNLTGGTLSATLAGTVIAVNGRQGASVEAGETIITLADLDNLFIEVKVDEDDFDKMVVGAGAEVVFDAIPKKTYTGKVTLVEPEIVKSGNYRLVQGLVALDIPASSTVKPLLGMNATVRVVSSEINNALFVPAEALRTIAEGEYAVFVAGSDGTMKLRAVKIGYQDKDRVEVTEGLTEGEIVSTGITSTTSTR